MNTRPFRNWLILLIALYGLLEAGSLGSLFLLQQLRNVTFQPADRLSETQRETIENLLRRPPQYIAFSPTLGWTVKPNGTSRLYQANSQGIRGDREYTPAPASSILRISSFGDSFTHCHDVENKDTWQEALAGFLPNSEVLNFGVGAYGLDQAFLRYQEDGVHFASHIVLIGYWPGDIYRNVNVFRPFLRPDASLALTKPRFVVKDDLVLLPNPIRELGLYEELLVNPRATLSWIGANDHFYCNTRYKSCACDFLPSVRLAKIAWSAVNRRYRDEVVSGGYYSGKSEALEVTRRIFDQFHASALWHGSLPIIVIFPGQDDIIRYLKDGTKKYMPMLQHFQRQRYQCIDLTDALEVTARNYGVGPLFSGHYSPMANELVAAHIYSYLAERELTDPARISDIIRGMQSPGAAPR